jgi:AcrR family transcriptional regulator
MEETRTRIARATYELHATVGPAQTTISAVAERAGVQRATVYKHFPEERDLHGACVDYALGKDPPPDPAAWAAVEDPRERLRTGLGELYGFFARNEGLLGNAVRDIPVVLPWFKGNPPESLLAFSALPGMLRDALAAGWATEDEASVRAILALAVDFTTWQALVRREGLSDERAIALFGHLVESVTVALSSPAGEEPSWPRPG